MGETIAMLVCVLGSAAIAALIHFWAGEKRVETRELILATMGYTFAILLLTCAVVFLRGHSVSSFIALFTSVGAIVKYGVVALAFAVLLPNAVLLVRTAARRIWSGRGKADE